MVQLLDIHREKQMFFKLPNILSTNLCSKSLMIIKHFLI